MRSTNVAKVYARSLYQLGLEQKVSIGKECFDFQQMVMSSNELENLLYLDIFTPVEKREVLVLIFEKIQVSSLFKNFVYFLIEEKRIGLFPGIFQEITLMEDEQQNFIRARVQGRMDQLDSTQEGLITQYLKSKMGKTPILEYEKNENILAGVRVSALDLHFDASLNHQLEQFKQSLLGE